MKYRREIDGLRALALLPVILFHAGFDVFSGGFVGVDVFFVISGYLICTIILVELERGTFSLVDFYERRARRILPALFLVMLFCIPFAWFWLLPRDMKDFSQSLIAVSAFASNFLFWSESGYFDTAAELKPLLHTWSLAVEEQFYILFPPLLMLCWRFGQRWMLAILLAIFAISLAGAEWGSFGKPAASFSLLPARAWELLIGAFAALYSSRVGRPEVGRITAEAAGSSGFALIVWSVFTYSNMTPYPGIYGLAPTVGTALIILFGTQQTLIGKFLGNRIFVGVGLLSYSAYLWHQPLFAFARHRSLSEPSSTVFASLSVLSLVLAYFSWKYVETPFRSRARFSRARIFVFAVAGTVFFVVAGLVGTLNNGFRHRLPPNLVWQSPREKMEAVGDVCDLKTLDSFPGVETCEFGDRNAEHSVLLYGDSHADAISEVLDKELSKGNIKGVRIALDDCQLVPLIMDTRDSISRQADCLDKFSNLLRYINLVDADLIVVSRWTFRLYPIKKMITDMPYKNSEGGVEKESYREYAVNHDGVADFSAEAKSDSLKSFIDGFLSTGVRVFFVYPIPEIGWNVADANWRHFQDKKDVLASVSIPYSDFLARNRFVTGVFDTFLGRKNFIPVSPGDIFCNSFVKGRCVAQFDAVPFYYDDDHLSDEGARYLVEELLVKINAR
jgi:peptidoglycan/LPS O-acetylase OafA/YrhL